MKLETPAATHHNDLDEFIDSLDEMLLPGLSREIEEQSVFDTTHAAPGFLGSTSIRSKEQRVQFPFGLRNLVTDYQESAQPKLHSALEKNLNDLLRIGVTEATRCREAPAFVNHDSNLDDSVEPFMDAHRGMRITSMPQGRFVYWKGMKTSDLLKDDRLVAHIETLPYQEGGSLASTVVTCTQLR